MTIDWSKYTPREIYDALREAPKVAGPWIEEYGYECRKLSDGQDLVYKWRIDVARDRPYLIVVGECESFETRDEADARLRELGWFLVDE